MASGLIVYFDGPDGAGKTTQLTLAADALRKQGQAVYVTRTLGGTPIGEELRAIALSGHERPSEVDLHIALACNYALAPEVIARREHGEVVLIDRSPLSFIGYQVMGDGLDPKRGYEAADAIFELIRPDLTLLYNASDETLLERRKKRDEGIEDVGYFENKPAAYHQRVADGLEAAGEYFKATVISAAGPPDEVHQATMQLLMPLLKA